MPEMIDAEAREQVKRLLGEMRGPVALVYFTQDHACAACRQQHALLEEVAALSDPIRLEVRAFEGALQAMPAAMEILRAVKPADYEQLEQALRDARGERRVTRPEPDHVYDVLVVGAGPAALTAAIYAVRKGLDVAVIGEHVGGQMTVTAVIENWPGMTQVAGRDPAALFQHHFELNKAAEALHVRVTKIAKEAEVFVAATDDRGALPARSVIYCAGKTYRTLGVPGESRFLGRGIAFCATCDAPLFRDKRVAVVGGGNSAFTAARDLLPFAREVHVVHILDNVQADPVLVDAVKADTRVTFHLSREVREFLGTDHLTGLRVRSIDGTEAYDLPVDGVFLEIGLVPNSEPVAELIALNGQSEIPVDRDQSTALPGFFTAGDVTDVPDKQIVIAAGEGAQAALSAHRYLMQMQSEKSRPEQLRRIEAAMAGVPG